MLKKTRIFVCSLLAVLSIGLSACHQPANTPALHACFARCELRQSSCLAHVNAASEQCYFHAYNAAKPAYLAYVKERKKRQRPVRSTQKEFANFSVCKTHYACTLAYKDCQKTCRP